MFLLDTNIVSELRKPRPHGGVVAWVKNVADRDLHICAVTLAEIQSGIEITRATDGLKAKEIEAWADMLELAFDILPMDSACFRRWARLMHGKSDALYEDAMIAATALEHELTVVTRNVKDFRTFGVPLVNPFRRNDPL